MISGWVYRTEIPNWSLETNVGFADSSKKGDTKTWKGIYIPVSQRLSEKGTYKTLDTA